MFGKLLGKGSRPKKYKTIDVRELKQMLAGKKKPLLIDVRSADEFAQGHIPGARLMPLFTLPVRHGELPQDRPIVVSCRSGSRSRMACEQLYKLGFTNLTNLKGGLMAWQGAGYKTTR